MNAGGVPQVPALGPVHLGPVYLVRGRIAPGKDTYWAEHGETGDVRVLKGYRRAMASATRRVEREWEVASRLGDGLRIPRAIERFDDEHTAWLVLEALPGRSLRHLLDEDGRRDAATVRRIGADLAEALAILHQAGLVHADLSPGNCVVTDVATAGLCDFGEATTGDDSGETQSFTPGYAAPERMQGRTVPASDIYSLGVTLHELWTGVPAEEGAGQRWPADCDDVALRRIIRDCMHPLAGRRPPADELARRLRRRPSPVDWRPAALIGGVVAAIALLVASGPLTGEASFVYDYDRDWTAIVRTDRPLHYYLTVPADEPWFTTGLRLESGDSVLIEATGTAGHSAAPSDRVGPAGKIGFYDEVALMPSAPTGALIGRIGEQGDPFFIGDGVYFVVETEGVLFLSMNDRLSGNGFLDNEGRWAVAIQRPAPILPAPGVEATTAN